MTGNPAPLPADTLDSSKVKVWDPLLRIFHGSLLIFFSIAYFSAGDDWLPLHVWSGYTIGLLIAFRLLWGFIGPRHARFSQFIRSPRSGLLHLQQMLRNRAPHYLGHNPAAALMIVALLSGLALLVFTGMTIIATEGRGPMASTFLASLPAPVMEDIHEFIADSLVLFIALHAAGVLFIIVLLRTERTKARS